MILEEGKFMNNQVGPQTPANVEVNKIPAAEPIPAAPAIPAAPVIPEAAPIPSAPEIPQAQPIPSGAEIPAASPIPAAAPIPVAPVIPPAPTIPAAGQEVSLGDQQVASAEPTPAQIHTAKQIIEPDTMDMANLAEQVAKLQTPDLPN